MSASMSVARSPRSSLGVPKGRQDEVQLLPVIPALPQRRGRLDEKHLAVGVLAAVHRRTELVGEQPQGSVVTRRWAHPDGITRIGGDDASPEAVGIAGGGCCSISTAAGDPGSTAGCGAAW